MPYVSRAGVRLYYADAGSGPVVLLHTGGGGDGRMWDLAGYVTALAGYRLLHGSAAVLPGLHHLQAFWRTDLSCPPLAGFSASTGQRRRQGDQPRRRSRRRPRASRPRSG